MTLQASEANIMVVDDTPANLRLLEGMLRERGHEVRSFPRGALALKAAENDPPDLILLDITMPEMDGFKVCQHLKENENLKEIPVIFISARTEMFDKVKAFRSGGVDYITKPFQFEEVLARVETHLQLRQYQVELEWRNKELQQALDELKAAQTQLVQSEKMASLGVLTAGIAHEINNPVNFIGASARGLRKILRHIENVLEQYGQINPDNALEELERINQFKQELEFDDLLDGLEELTANIHLGAERTAEIVKGLRTFSRLDEVEKKLADIHENLDSTLALLRNQYKGTITIRKDYGDVPPIMCYPGKLNQVFINILANAIDAIKRKEGPSAAEEIRIKTSLVDKEDKRFVTIEFIDTGPGIPEQIQNRIFEPFFTTKDVGKGTGLGLSISLGIIESHGGTIKVESTPGKGANFRICLPLQQGE